MSEENNIDKLLQQEFEKEREKGAKSFAKNLLNILERYKAVLSDESITLLKIYLKFYIADQLDEVKNIVKKIYKIM